MITCRFHGGLGNNLFQLAALLGFEVRGKEILLIDRVHRGLVEMRENNDPLITKHIPKKLELKQMFNYDYNFLDSETFDTFFAKSFRFQNHPDLTHSGDFGFNEIPDSDFVILNGYYQSEAYFKFFEDQLRNSYFLPNVKVYNSIKERFDPDKFYNSVSLHTRRTGDRHHNDMQDYFKDLKLDYYHKALKIICERAKIDRVFIVSDDSDYCRAHVDKIVPKSFKKEVIVISGNKNYEDLFFMSFCDHNIVANSTFSWWSAWLNKNKSKIVVAPELDWFGPKLKHMNLDNLFPSGWITL